MNTSLGNILKHAALLFLGVLLAAWLVPSITYATTSDLLLAALVLAVLNALLKPILILFVLPFVIFTLGLGLIVINAGLLYLTSAIVPAFAVATFWGAFFGALIISIVHGFALALLMPNKSKFRVQWSNSTRGSAPRKKPARAKDDDVIDV
jgi:putative membrane protein